MPLSYFQQSTQAYNDIIYMCIQFVKCCFPVCYRHCVNSILTVTRYSIILLCGITPALPIIPNFISWNYFSAITNFVCSDVFVKLSKPLRYSKGVKADPVDSTSLIKNELGNSRIPFGAHLSRKQHGSQFAFPSRGLELLSDGFVGPAEAHA